MKKTRLLASFLSLTLGLTSFSTAPAAISAETDETSKVLTTTSTESQDLAPIIHDIDVAREKFEKYIEENNIPANIADEEKYPQYTGKIVIEGEANTQNQLFKFADENLILHELFEFVIKFDANKTVTYTVSFRFVDEETGENVEDINAKLYRYKNKLESNEDDPGSYHITRDLDVEPVLIAEWNSTETPVFTSEPITSYLAQYSYGVITDKLPEGYNFYGKDHAESGYSGSIGDGDHSINIKINKGKPTPETVDIPLEGTFSLDVRVIDKNRNIPLKGMECEVFEKYSGEVVAEWNTSNTEVMHIEGLEYKFEGNKIMEDFGKKIYQFRITNLPENYVYNGYLKDSLPLCGIYIDEFADSNELSATAYLIDQSADAPVIPATTSAFSQVSTTIMTTTSVAESTPREEAKFGFEHEGEGDSFSEEVYVGTEVGFTITGLKDGESVTYSLSDEEVGKIAYSDNKQVTVSCLKAGKTVLTAKSSDGQSFEVEIIIKSIDIETISLKGDANCDGELSMADAVLIMQSIANPAKFGIEGTDENHITEQGKKNADIAGDNDGITNADALEIQKKLLKLD